MGLLPAVVEKFERLVSCYSAGKSSRENLSL